MKLSSISPVAAILAAMAGGVTAAPAPRPFKRDVDVYSRATQEEHTAIAHHRAACNLSWQAANLADFLRKPHIAATQDEPARLNHMHGEGHRAGATAHGDPYPLESIAIANDTIDLAHKDIKTGRRMIVDYIKVKTQRRLERHEGR